MKLTNVMDVKDVRTLGALGNSATRPQSDSKTGLSALVAGTISDKTKADQVSLRDRAGASKSIDIRKRINDLVGRAHIATQATEQIDGLVQSISGILEQAAQTDIGIERKSVLEKEAKELVKEVTNVADTVKANKAEQPVADEVRSDVEKQLRQALDAIFPDDPKKDPLALGNIDFSNKEAIINTAIQIERVHRQIKELSEKVNEASKNVRLSANFTEVALQNTEASQSSVRDLDSALKLAHRTKQNIDKDRDAAIGSIGEIGTGALNLLKLS